MRRLTTLATATSLALALGSIALAQSGGSGSGSGGAGTMSPGGTTTSPGSPRQSGTASPSVTGGQAAPQSGSGAMGTGSGQQPSGTAASPSTTTPRTGAAPQPGAQAGKDENNAHWRRLSEDWKSHSGDVRKEWPQLTEADVNAINGRRSELVSRLQTRYRISAAEADRQVSRFEQRER